MKPSILPQVTFALLVFASNPSVFAQAPAAPQRAEPASPPAKGTPNPAEAPNAPVVSGVGGAPHEILFKKVDTDGNGTISPSEFRIAVTTGVIPQAGVGAGAPAKPEGRTGTGGGTTPQGR